MTVNISTKFRGKAATYSSYGIGHQRGIRGIVSLGKEPFHDYLNKFTELGMARRLGSEIPGCPMKDFTVAHIFPANLWSATPQDVAEAAIPQSVPQFCGIADQMHFAGQARLSRHLFCQNGKGGVAEGTGIRNMIRRCKKAGLPEPEDFV